MCMYVCMNTYLHTYTHTYTRKLHGAAQTKRLKRSGAHAAPYNHTHLYTYIYMHI